MAHNEYILIVTILTALLAIGVIGCMVVRRWLKAYVIRITDDYSNINAGYRVYYALYNKKDDVYILMRTLLSIWPYKTVPFVNLSAYSYGRKTVDAIESYTGSANDTILIPVHHTTPSRLGIENWLATLQGNLVKRAKEGVEIEEKGKDAEGKETTKKTHIKLNLSDDDKKNVEKLFDLKWFGEANGFLPVENIGTLTEGIRQAAKHFYAKSYDKQREGESWFSRNGVLLAFGITLFIVMLGGVIYWQAFFSNLSNFCAAGYCPNYKPTSSTTTGSILPTPVTNTLVQAAGGT